MSILRQYIRLVEEETIPVPNEQQSKQRARELAQQMGMDPNNIKVKSRGGVPVEINGKPVPTNLYKETEIRLMAAAQQLSTGNTAPRQTPGIVPPDSPYAQQYKQQPTTATQADVRKVDNAIDKPTPGDPKVAALQQDLKAAGADLGPFENDGVDGLMGKYTRAAMAQFPEIAAKHPEAAKMPDAPPGAGRQVQGGQSTSPTGQGAAASPSAPPDLVKALSTIETILAKYQVKLEEISSKKYVLENINKFSLEDQISIWRQLANEQEMPSWWENPDRSLRENNPPDLWDDNRPLTPDEIKQKKKEARARLERERALNPGNRLGTLANAERNIATPKPSFWNKFVGKLGGAAGIGKKLAGRAAATAVSGPAGVLVGAGMAAWTAWDIGKALYDTFTSTDIDDLEDADQEAVKQALPVILKYEKDQEKFKALPLDIQQRVAVAMKGLKALSAT